MVGAAGNATADHESPDLPWKIKATFSLYSTISEYTRRIGSRRFLDLINLTVPVPSKPLPDLNIVDVTVDPSRNLWFRLFVPKTSDSEGDSTASSTRPVFIYFHGGGFTSNSPDSKPFDSICRTFARELQAIVVSINYRRAPEHRYPSQYDDGFDTLKFLEQRSFFQEFPSSADLTRCFIAGDSAGGNIAHNVARRVAEADFKELRVIGLVAIQPFFGGEERTNSEIRLSRTPSITVEGANMMWKLFLPEGSDRDHEAANVTGPKSRDISGVAKFPASLVVVGGCDPLHDWQRRYYQWLIRAGKEAYLVEYPKAIHGFYAFPELPETSCLFMEVKDFFQKQCNKV